MSLVLCLAGACGAASSPALDDDETSIDAGIPSSPPMPDAGACSLASWDGRLIQGTPGPLVSYAPSCNALAYTPYANEGQSNAEHLIPDFSHAGYGGGGVPIPDVPAVEVIGPVAGDAHATIQAAIDRVSALPLGPDGVRGAVELSAGRYEVSESLRIRASGVVLRGAGQSVTGTVLVATAPQRHDLIVVRSAGATLQEIAGSRVAITSPYVAVGSRSFDVASTTGLAVGDRIAVLRTPNQAWIDAVEMAPWGWTPESYAIAHSRTIVAIQGMRITVDIPMVDTLEQGYGGGVVYRVNADRITRCGVEDLRLESTFVGPEDEDHAWNAVMLSRVDHSWVRRVTAEHFANAAVNIDNGSRFITVEEVAQLDPVSRITGGRRYSFNVSDGLGILFQRCYAREGRHDFVSGARVTGPVVWLDSLSTRAHADSGPHHRWATGLLFDNVKTRDLNVQNRADLGTGHGWAGAQVMLWNVEALELRADAPHGAMNWAVGAVGQRREGSEVASDPFGIWQSLGTRVEPRSLYLAQLADRLGLTAVVDTTTAPQRAGAIWPQLSAWAGQRRLSEIDPARAAQCTGLLNEEVCCAASCGTCGGSGCGSAPGGSASCCAGAIRASGRSCSTSAPPCLTQ